VVPRNYIACVHQKFHPYVVPTTAIACGPQNCHRIWSTELTSYVFPTTAIICGPQNCHHMVPRNAIFMCYPELTSVYGSHKCHRMWSPELTALCGPHNFHRMWSPDLPLHGPQYCHPNVVPGTNIRMRSPQLTSYVISRTDVN
jgi:hypothetical protein